MSPLAAVLGLAGIIVTAAVGWLVAKRTTSGEVTTTEAATLWEEAGKMRAEYRSDAEEARAAHKQCEADLRVSRLAIAELEARSNAAITELEGRVAELEGGKS